MDTNIGYMSPSSFFLWQDAHVASLAGQWARMLLGSLYPQFVFMALRKYVKELHCNNIQDSVCVDSVCDATYICTRK